LGNYFVFFELATLEIRIIRITADIAGAICAYLIIELGHSKMVAKLLDRSLAISPPWVFIRCQEIGSCPVFRGAAEILVGKNCNFFDFHVQASSNK
jgi:hypothetical protein